MAVQGAPRGPHHHTGPGPDAIARNHPGDLLRLHSPPSPGEALSWPRLIHHTIPTMTTTCLLAWALVLLLAPVLFLAWLTESRTDRARRWRAQGLSQARIADRLGVSRHQVRKLLS